MIVLTIADSRVPRMSSSAHSPTSTTAGRLMMPPSSGPPLSAAGMRPAEQVAEQVVEVAAPPRRDGGRRHPVLEHRGTPRRPSRRSRRASRTRRSRSSPTPAPRRPSRRSRRADSPAAIAGDHERDQHGGPGERHGLVHHEEDAGADRGADAEHRELEGADPPPQTAGRRRRRTIGLRRNSSRPRARVRGCSAMAAAMCSISSGPTRQHPPTRRAPRADPLGRVLVDVAAPCPSQVRESAFHVSPLFGYATKRQRRHARGGGERRRDLGRIAAVHADRDDISAPTPRARRRPRPTPPMRSAPSAIVRLIQTGSAESVELGAERLDLGERGNRLDRERVRRRAARARAAAGDARRAAARPTARSRRCTRCRRRVPLRRDRRMPRPTPRRRPGRHRLAPRGPARPCGRGARPPRGRRDPPRGVRRSSPGRTT